ncbi:MAG: hypothetical protein ACREGB_04785 [Candidatus Saccharimonadales bacterium]
MVGVTGLSRAKGALLRAMLDELMQAQAHLRFSYANPLVVSAPATYHAKSPERPGFLHGRPSDLTLELNHIIIATRKYKLFNNQLRDLLEMPEREKPEQPVML